MPCTPLPWPKPVMRLLLLRTYGVYAGPHVTWGVLNIGKAFLPLDKSSRFDTRPDHRIVSAGLDIASWTNDNHSMIKIVCGTPSSMSSTSLTPLGSLGVTQEALIGREPFRHYGRTLNAEASSISRRTATVAPGSRTEKTRTLES